MLKNVSSSAIGIFTLKLIAFVILLGAGTVFGQIEIAELKDLSVAEGCSCSAQTMEEAKKPDSEKVIFLSESGSGEGWMNINGKDTKLKLVKSTENDVGEGGVGSRYYEEYSAKGMKVRVDYRMSRDCPPPANETSCEHVEYDITITFTRGKESKAVKAKGFCSC